MQKTQLKIAMLICFKFSQNYPLPTHKVKKFFDKLSYKFLPFSCKKVFSKLQFCWLVLIQYDLATVCNNYNQKMHQTLNKTFQDRGCQNRTAILSTLHKGFNTFHEIIFPSAKKSRLLVRSKRMKTLAQQSSQSQKKPLQKDFMTNSFDESCPVLSDTLRQNKFRLGRVKTQVDELRYNEFNDYIKKSLRYQQLLNLNENKKKHLPTLNSKIGQVVKKSAIQAQQKNISYEIKYQKITLEAWKPQSRQGHSCIVFKNNAIIIGGHCSHPFSTVQVYSFQKNNWIKQISTPTARSYHSSLLYKNRFIITFGGMGTYDVSRKCRGCFNTVSLIDVANFTNRQMKMHNEDTIEARRSHSAVLMSKNMVVFGGMNAKKQFLSDLVYLDLKQLRWYHKQYKTQGKQLNEQMQSGIAKHKAITVFKERKHLTFYQADYSEYQGVYIFGGGFGNGSQNTVLQISFNKYIPVLKKVDYSGLPPSSIYPVLQRFNEMIIIVSGDQKQRQIRLFKPHNRQFTIINDSYSKLLGGIGSSITQHENSYHVFFGLGQEGYIGAISNFVIEEKIKEKENKKRKLTKYTNGQILDWRDPNWKTDSDDEDYF